METTTSQATNLVDRAAASADGVIESTRNAANNALDGVSDKIEGVRSRVSPVVARAGEPLDKVVAYTRENPTAALLMAAAAGATLMAFLSAIRR